MLGPNPRRAGMSTASSIVVPSPSSEMPPKMAATAQQSDGLMVKAIDEIFRHVEMNDEPNNFKVNNRVWSQIFVPMIRRNELVCGCFVGDQNIFTSID